MIPIPLSPTSTRELAHLLILQELGAVRRGGGVILKGGVNLRLFFGSPRYSEDMDLDGSPDGSGDIRTRIARLFDDRAFTRRLQTFGIRGLDPGEGPNEDTEATFRYKFGVIGTGGVRYPTKVEVSFRAQHAADAGVEESPAKTVLDSYGLNPFDVRHYAVEAAVRQKIQALAGRREAQARDVFDLSVLVRSAPAVPHLEFLAQASPADQLEEAHARALTISYEEYRGQVTEFLDEPERAARSTEAAWDDMRLRVAALMEAILARAGHG
ncbi:MAG: nucleotidyl transferase AbiEii/AbiGii toxin family protein [Gemmatimonadetes bacterium]|nr:nucleotidyl transferase AbiEii/AbiGii toxin family protein [Gemmatimonadota bacterium]